MLHSFNDLIKDIEVEQSMYKTLMKSRLARTPNKTSPVTAVPRPETTRSSSARPAFNMNDSTSTASLLAPVGSNVTTNNTLITNSTTATTTSIQRPTALVHAQPPTTIPAFGIGAAGNRKRTAAQAQLAEAGPASNQSEGDLKDLKRKLTLDFTSPETAKKSLQTPDVIRTVLKLTSPELEKFIYQVSGSVTVTTPTPTQILFPKNVTSPQRQYAQGFLDALNALYRQTNFVPPPNLLSPIYPPGSSVAVTPSDTCSTSSSASTGDTKSTSDSTASASTLSFVNALNTAVSSAVSNSSSFTAGGLIFVRSPSGSNVPCSVQPLIMHSMPGTGPNGNNMIFNPNQLLNQFQLHNSQQPQQQFQMPDMGMQPHPVQSSSVPSSSHMNTAFMPPTMTSSSMAHPVPSSSAYGHHGPGPASVTGSLMTDEDSISVVSSTPSPGPSGSTLHPSRLHAFGLPIDPLTQETHKRERKKERNRLAATKCRQKKLDRIGELELEVGQFEQQLAQATAEENQMAQQLAHMNHALEQHRLSGCELHDIKVVANVQPMQRK